MGIARRGKKGLFQHFRRVPMRFRGVEARELIRTALHTTDETVAVTKATEIEALQDARWEALLAGRSEDAGQIFDTLRELAERRCVTYLPARDVAALPLSMLIDRVEKAGDDPALGDALLGAAEIPKLLLSALVETYEGLIADRLHGKDRDQLRRWRTPRQKAVRNFINVVGDSAIQDLSREQALEFRRWWWQRIEAGEVSENSANKDMTFLSAMLDGTSKLKGWDISSPFAGLRFQETENRRPPFSKAWIEGQILATGALSGLNAEARDILLAMVNTGARPSEIIELRAAHIRLDVAVPHVAIMPEGRVLKTSFSKREIPLVGVSLDALRRHPNGFVRYRGKTTNWSNAATKYLKENGLLETGKHSAYSLRHALSDRLQNAGCEDRTRKEILGHRPEGVIYGTGASLSVKADWLGRVAF